MDKKRNPEAARASSVTSDRDSTSGVMMLDEELLERLDIEILEKVAQGGMGVVFLGRQRFLNRIVAVKVSFFPEDVGSDRASRRFAHEAKILASLNHPGIVACHHAGVTDRGQQYMVMEFIDGPTLRTFVDDRGPLSERDALVTLRKLILALQYALKQGIIHCDLKPSNVLLDPATSEDASSSFPFEPKLSDLGMARNNQYDVADEITLTDSMLGTPLVMSPEQLENDPDVDYRSDVYALGCMLYFLLTQTSPFQQNNIPAIYKAKMSEDYVPLSRCGAHISRDSQELVAAMLAPQKEGRPSYDELLGHIERQLGMSSKAVAVPKEMAAPAVEKKRSRNGLLILAGATVLVGAVAVYYSPLVQKPAPVPEETEVAVAVPAEPTAEAAPPVAEVPVPGESAAVAVPAPEAQPEAAPADPAVEPATVAAAPAEPAQPQVIPFDPAKAPFVINEFVIRTEPKTAESEFIEIRSMYPGMSMAGLTLILLRGEPGNLAPGTVTHRFDFDAKTITDSNGFYLLSNQTAARDFSLKPQHIIPGLRVIDDAAVTAMLIRSADAPRLSDVVPADHQFASGIMDAVSVTGPSLSQQQVFFNAPRVYPDDSEVAPGAIRVSRKQADGSEITGWITAAKHAPPATFNTPGRENDVPDTLLASAQLEPAMAVLSPEVATPVPTPTPREDWRGEDLATLTARLASLNNAVIYLRADGTDTGKTFEKEVLLDKTIDTMLAGREKIFVVVKKEQQEQIKQLLPVQSAPSLVIYNSSSSVKVLNVTKNTNLTDLGMFLMGAGQ